MTDRLPDLVELTELIARARVRFGIDFVGKYSREPVTSVILASALHEELKLQGLPLTESPRPRVATSKGPP